MAQLADIVNIFCQTKKKKTNSSSSSYDRYDGFIIYFTGWEVEGRLEGLGNGAFIFLFYCVC